MKLEFPPFDSGRVLVVGDLMLDRYYHGAASRISPEAPVPVVQVEEVSERPGGAGNVALNLATLGVATTLHAAVGEDSAADSLQATLAGAGVACQLHRHPGVATTTKLRIISRQQQLLRLDFEEPSLPLPQSAGQDALLAEHDVLVLSDYGRGALAAPEALVMAAKQREIPVLVDPKGADLARFRGADLLTPNRQEFETVVGVCTSEAELAARGQALIKDLELGALLVTRGEHGMTLLRPGQEALHLPARAREVFDVTGAGDTVVATVAASLAAGSALPQAVALANLAAGLVVAQLGTAAVSGPQLRRALAREQGVERGVLGREQLQLAVADARSQGERIVFTNGCFDILHAGHVAYLEEARTQGDRLVVAVNSDESVRQLKGDGRPVNNLERRMAVLAGLGSVDWVVDFDEQTPEPLLSLLQPDVLVKGGDYDDPRNVIGWEIVQSYGGQVKLMGRVEGLSTSATVSHIRDGSKG